MCICITESLCWVPEASPTLLTTLQYKTKIKKTETQPPPLPCLPKNASFGASVVGCHQLELGAVKLSGGLEQAMFLGRLLK